MKVNKKIELLMELRESKAKQIRSLEKEVEELTSKIWVEMKIQEEKGGKNVERNNNVSNIEPNINSSNNSAE